MNLYHVQDSDRPMWVLADSFQNAVYKWKVRIAEENEIPLEEIESDCPKGIHLICEDDELIL